MKEKEKKIHIPTIFVKITLKKQQIIAQRSSKPICILNKENYLGGEWGP